MIASMTAFARQAHEDEWGTLTWEIRTVNHRYLEISLRLPEILRPLEQAIRQKIQAGLARGKVDATLKYVPGQLPYQFTVNEDLICQLASAGDVITRYFPQAQLNITDLLSWNGVLHTQDMHLDALNESVFTLLEAALTNIKETRTREGKGLKAFLKKRVIGIREEAAAVQTQAPKVLAAQQARIEQRFKELSVNLDADRLHQELLLLAQKMDIAEELQRLHAHLEEVERVLEQGGIVGRRLDFLMQELNREVNTLGSKSIEAAQTQAVVEMKVHIEQMREQVQNIE